MESLKDIIYKYSEYYQEGKRLLSESNQIERKLMNFVNVDDDEEFQPYNPDDYSEYAILLMPASTKGLFYLSSPNKARPLFHNQEIIDFFRNKRINYLIGIVSEPDEDYDEDNEQDNQESKLIPISAFALPIIEKDAEAFEKLGLKIGDMNFRYMFLDDIKPGSYNVPGWSFYKF